LNPAAPFGPLTGLIGTWTGENGYNLVALPNVDTPGNASFTVVVNRFREQITFKPIEDAVLNRGYEDANQATPQKNQSQTLLGLSYHLEDRDLISGNLIHVEDGQWLWNVEPGVVSDWTVVRMAEIPHGNSPQALGLDTQLTGLEVEKELRDMVDAPEWSVNPQQPHGQFINGAGYFDPERDTACKENGVHTDVCATPVQKLLDDSIPFSSIKKAVKLDVKTSFPGGSMGLLPGIKRQVFNTLFNSTFFIESTNGVDFTQFQYAQTVMFHFLCTETTDPKDCSLPENVDATSAWPHVQVNTLTKVPEAHPPSSPSRRRRQTLEATIR